MRGGGSFSFGIFMAHLGVLVDPVMLQFCQNAGLVIFVYALALGGTIIYRPSLRKSGLALNAWSMALVLLGLLAVVILVVAGVDSASNMMVLSGAVTNTPALAAAQQGKGADAC